MRYVIIFCVSLLGIAIANGQEQERKLLDRLLKPDTTLQNEAQGKQFVPAGGTITKTARTKSFFFFQRKPEKQYAGVRNFSAKEFSTQKSRFENQSANLRPRNQLAKLDAPYGTGTYETRSAIDAGKTADSPAYSGVRPFLDKGKSQKSLSAQHPQMTIEEVRELLNKNK